LYGIANISFFVLGWLHKQEWTNAKPYLFHQPGDEPQTSNSDPMMNHWAEQFGNGA